MPNDAKLGMVVGVGVVILVAVLFFGKELVPEPAAQAAPVTVTAAPPAPPAVEERAKVQMTSQTKPTDADSAAKAD